MRSYINLLVVLLAVGQQMSGKTMPEGFRVVGQNGPAGQALYGSFSSTGDAQRTFPGIWGLLTPYFDQRPTLLGAAIDKHHEHVQAFLRGTFGGAPVRGLLVVSVANGRGYAGLMFDREEQWGRSLPVLARQLAGAVPPEAGSGGNGGGLAAPAQPLRQTQFPDGSGTIGLPAGWRITGAYKGTVDITGPHGENASFGGYQNAFIHPMPGYPASGMRGPYRPPSSAWPYYLDVLTQGAFSRRQAMYRPIEQLPVAASQGQAAYVSYEVQMQGKTAYGLAMVNTAPIDQSMWFFYSSCIAAPAEVWPRSFSTMWAMWKSWSVNPAVYRERMDEALRSMKQTYSIIQSVHDNQQHVYDNVNKAWDQVIRGVTTVEHTTTGRRGEVDTRIVDDVVTSLNAQEHAAVWRTVPMQELVPR